MKPPGEEAASRPEVTPGQRVYLEADLEVVAELGAAAQLAVQALVDEAVEFVRAVAAVVVAVAQQGLVQAFPVAAHERGLVALPLCKGKREERVRRLAPLGTLHKENIVRGCVCNIHHSPSTL